MRSNRPAFLGLVLTAALTAVCSCSTQPLYSQPPVSGEHAVIEIASLAPDAPQFYTYRLGRKKVTFFVLMTQDRVISFFDACITCYPKKRGYRHEDGGVTCRACDMRFAIAKLEKGIGGCYPIRLEGRLENNRYLIPLSALERMADKF